MPSRSRRQFSRSIRRKKLMYGRIDVSKRIKKLFEKSRGDLESTYLRYYEQVTKDNRNVSDLEISELVNAIVRARIRKYKTRRADRIHRKRRKKSGRRPSKRRKKKTSSRSRSRRSRRRRSRSRRSRRSKKRRSKSRRNMKKRKFEVIDLISSDEEKDVIDLISSDEEKKSPVRKKKKCQQQPPHPWKEDTLVKLLKSKTALNGKRLNKGQSLWIFDHEEIGGDHIYSVALLNGRNRVKVKSNEIQFCLAPIESSSDDGGWQGLEPF